MTDDTTMVPSTPVSRRRFLQGTTLAGFGAFLAACSTGATASPSASAGASAGPSTGASPSASAGASTGTVTGPLNFANWDAYIDLAEDEVTSPTIEDFKAQYNVDVNYANAKIEDNETFVASIRPQLEAGVDTGWDLIILTDWMAANLIGLGWIEAIDQANVPNCVANVRSVLKGLEWDPDMTYHYPWQSGATGVGYNVVSAGRDLTKIADLFDPAFSGKMTLLTEVRDTFPLIHMMLQTQGKASANKPEEMTVEDAQVVADYLKPLVESGQIKNFTGNEYLLDFASGDTWVALVWSGDLASSGGPDDRFVYPDEGSMLWNDNMLMPKGAKNKYTAELMMNWVYDVERAARIADYIYYISPVEGVAEAIKAIDPEAEGNPLLFPPADVAAKSHPAPNWDEKETTEINALFADLTGV